MSTRPSSVRSILPRQTGLALLAAVLPLASSLQADNLFWNLPGDGVLNDSGSWNPEIAPTDADRLYFEQTGDYTVSTSGAITVNSIDARATSGTLTLNLSSGTLRIGEAGYSPIVANQAVVLNAGTLEGGLQVGVGSSGASFTVQGGGAEVISSGGHIGRSSNTVVGNSNSLLITDGGKFTSTTGNALIIGSNTSQVAANANVVTVTGNGSVLASTAGVIVGNIGSATSGAQAQNNRLIITNGATANIGSLLLARRGTGSLNTANGNRVEVGGGTGNSQLTIGTAVSIGTAGQNNTVTVNQGGTIQARGGATTIIGRTGNGLHVMSGTYDAGGQAITAGAGAQISLRETGVLRAESITLTGTAQFGFANNAATAFSGGLLEVDSLNASAATYTFTIGSNLVEHSATYQMTGNGLHQFNSGLLVTANGRLSGSGNVATGSASLSNQGVIGSLTSVSLIDLDGALISTADAVYEFFVQDANTYGRLQSDGSIGVNGTLRLAFADGYNPEAGAVYDLFDFTDISGQFTSIELATLSNGLAWDTSKLYVDGTVAVIPEGHTYGMLLSGMVLLIGAWHRLPAKTR